MTTRRNPMVDLDGIIEGDTRDRFMLIICAKEDLVPVMVAFFVACRQKKSTRNPVDQSNLSAHDSPTHTFH